jgi:succinate dehydrogenase hydrophobic anchor subunit
VTTRGEPAADPESARPGVLRRVRRKATAVLIACAIALLLGVVLTAVLLRVSGSVNQALQALHAARPWLIAAQMCVLGLLWHFWPALVARLVRWRHLSPTAESALLRGRTRIFLLLGACELLVVLRALLA